MPDRFDGRWRRQTCRSHVATASRRHGRYRGTRPLTREMVRLGGVFQTGGHRINPLDGDRKAPAPAAAVSKVWLKRSLRPRPTRCALHVCLPRPVAVAAAGEEQPQLVVDVLASAECGLGAAILGSATFSVTAPRHG